MTQTAAEVAAEIVTKIPYNNEFRNPVAQLIEYENQVEIILKRHVDAVTAEKGEVFKLLKQQLERAKTYVGVEGYHCPLCEYKNGKFVKSCQMHADIEQLKRQLVEADDFLDELESIWEYQLRYLRRDHSLEALRTLRKQLVEVTKPEEGG